uniref:Uncharacterized protein n=1 Tax=Lactuca sativa TaxID=4236 RepID=A0A9R1V8L3_LACSA|nr:hypothetical protein LSAT_V11C600328690 [Lactuca sativa]
MGTFRWHICFNFVVLRMISFRYDYYSADHNPYVDQEEKHVTECYRQIVIVMALVIIVFVYHYECYSKIERSVGIDKLSYTIYLCYLLYAPLYIAGHIITGYTLEELYTETSGLVWFSLGP